ncbi:MAG: aminotransferase class V-fold PLP-dependent enzyme, partial [Lentisphaerae bacterium]
MSIYLDNSATTKPLPRVVDEMVNVLSEGFGNPSSGHALGREARNALSLARRRVADFICADSEQIVFTSGATEA